MLVVVALTVGCTSQPPPAPRAANAAVPGDVARVVETVRSLLGTPYRYRGSDPTGFDCSGLTSFAFASVGVDLPRRAEDQAAIGRRVATDELQIGDLVFFGASRSELHHVGLVVSAPGEPLTMIHASSSRGVVETEILGDAYWLARLKFGRRVLSVD
jgi:cell wall-associated NlpC family hydrolase